MIIIVVDRNWQNLNSHWLSFKSSQTKMTVYISWGLVELSSSIIQAQPNKDESVQEVNNIQTRLNSVRVAKGWWLDESTRELSVVNLNSPLLLILIWPSLHNQQVGSKALRLPIGTVALQVAHIMSNSRQLTLQQIFLLYSQRHTVQ